MPSSSLVELEVGVEVGVKVGVEAGAEVGVGVEVGVGDEVGLGVEVGVGAWVKMQFSFLTFSVRWVGGEMEIKANLSLSLDEVEAELGKNMLKRSSKLLLLEKNINSSDNYR